MIIGTRQRASALIARAALLSTLVLSAASTRAVAQRPDSAQCRALIAQPVRDSITVTVGITVRAFDTTKAISAPMRAALASAVRESLRLPNPLPLVIYTINDPRAPNAFRDSALVVPTIAGAYAAELWPNGRITNVRVTGGGRAIAFDDALVNALRMVSDSSLLPPMPGSFKKPLEIRLGVSEMSESGPDTTDRLEVLVPSEPLFRMRVPVLGFGKPVTIAPGTAGPPYPESARQARAEGNVRLRFVVNEDGRGDVGSLQVRQATLLEFLSATLRAFPSFRFTPLEFRGCPLPSLVELPFEFRLRR